MTAEKLVGDRVEAHPAAIERLGERKPSRRRPAGDDDAGEAALLEGIDDGARRTAGPEYDGLGLVVVPCGRVLVERGREPFAVRRVAAEEITLEPERVHRTRPPGRRGEMAAKRRHGLLVRHGDVAADEPGWPHRRNKGRELFGRHRDPLVGALECVAVEPITVDERRPRMRDRPADDEGFPRHQISTAPWSRKALSSSSIGRPRIVDCSPTIRSNRWIPSPSTA